MKTSCRPETTCAPMKEDEGMSMHRATLVILFLLSHSLVIGREPVKEPASPGEMSSTFGGSPVGVAAALANLEVI